MRRRATRALAAAALAGGLAGAWAIARDALERTPPPERARPPAATREDPAQARRRPARPGSEAAPRRRAAPGRRAVRSRAVGLPWRGRLVAGVQLPARGRGFFTWDPIRERSPNRAWRRWGTARLVATLRRVLREFAAAHPGASPVGVGDLSRPRGGDFGRRFGAPGHVSHENGLDADVYYPRRDGAERAADTPTDVDRALAQDLVDRFVRAGAVKVFVGPRLGLEGDPAVVQPLRLHDDHLHVRLAPDAR